MRPCTAGKVCVCVSVFWGHPPRTSRNGEGSAGARCCQIHRRLGALLPYPRPFLPLVSRPARREEASARRGWESEQNLEGDPEEVPEEAQGAHRRGRKLAWHARECSGTCEALGGGRLATALSRFSRTRHVRTHMKNENTNPLYERSTSCMCVCACLCGSLLQQDLLLVGKLNKRTAMAGLFGAYVSFSTRESVVILMDL